jgi:diguanylate cyclase (GGDEF)-like protein
MIISLCLVYIFSSILIGLAWQQVNSRIDRDYNAELQLVWRESFSLVRAFEGFARSIFGNTETGLQMLSSHYGPAGRLTHDMLQEHFKTMAALSQLHSLAAYDLDGQLVAATVLHPVLPELKIKDHLANHTKNLYPDLFIDKPVQCQTATNYCVPVSMPLEHPDGGIEGVIVALIPTEVFANYFRQLHLGDDKLIVMTGTDGIIRVRQFHDKISSGGDLKNSHLFRTELPKALSGRYYATATIDEVPRYFTYVSMFDYPLVILVGVSETDLLAKFYGRRQEYFQSAITVTLLVLSFCVLLTWLLLRQYRIQRVLRDSNELASFLHATSLDIMNRREVVDLLETIIKKGSEITGASSGSVLLFNEERTERIRVVATGQAAGLLGSRNPIEDGAAGEVWRTGNLVWINNYKEWSGRVEPAAVVAEAVVYFPLKSSAEVVGVIGLWHTERGKMFVERDVVVIEQLASLASIAYETAFLYREAKREIAERIETEGLLQFRSFHDSLTGLYNRSYFEEEMRRQDMRRSGAVTVFVFDVDGLKLINDTLGHDRGDMLLAKVAQLLQSCFREVDIVARIGGDEFAALVVDADESAAKLICARIYQELARWNKTRDQEVLSLSVGFAASANPETKMRELYKRADDNMYREKLHRRQSNRSAIVDTVMKLLEARDFITEGHADRMQELAVKLGLALNFSEARLADMRLFAKFHDVGKVGIPDRILLKEGPLDPDEKKEMQRHCEIGYRIAQSAPDLLPIADWVLRHQEWWNGQGYPLGISGEDIPIECRILSIVDAYDAMTSDRPYRKAISQEQAIGELRRCAGSQFEPELVERFIELLK